MKVDIIFIDTPFKEKKINELIVSILDKKNLINKGLIIIHRNKKISENICEKLNILDIRNYGLSKIIFASN